MKEQARQKELKIQEAIKNRQKQINQRNKEIEDKLNHKFTKAEEHQRKEQLARHH